ncbi:MAG: hypothetical protein WAV68_03110 [Candidatus Nanogingivalis sp.]
MAKELFQQYSIFSNVVKSTLSDFGFTSFKEVPHINNQSVIYAEHPKGTLVSITIKRNEISVEANKSIFTKINIFGEISKIDYEIPILLISKLEELTEVLTKAMPKTKPASYDCSLGDKILFDKDGDVKFRIVRELNFEKSQRVHLQGTINPDDKIFLVQDGKDEFVYLLSDIIREELVYFDF